jgi:hypothetical protein
MHPVIASITAFITQWENPDNSRDYLYTNCYKVIG